MSGSESVVVIGSGAAGRAAAKDLAASGRQVTVVERDRVGGTCLWRGCIPKKALYVAARAVRDARRAGQYGVDCGDVRVDWPEVLAWKWHAQESFAGDQEALLTARGIRLLCGSARFVSETSVVVGDEVVSADHLVLATGSVPVIPDIPGAELADTSEGALRFPAPPARSSSWAGASSPWRWRASSLRSGRRCMSSSVGRPDLLDARRVARTSGDREALRDGRSLPHGRIPPGAPRRPPAAVPSLLLPMWNADGSTASLSCERVSVATGRRPAFDGLDLRRRDPARRSRPSRG